MSGTDYKFEGYGAFDKDCVEKGDFRWFEYTPKHFCDDDIDIKIMYAGICASDLHTASSGWGPADYPQVVGHEIVGEVVRVGKDVKHLKVGDIAGVGAQNDSCLNCEQCNRHYEQYCDNGQVGTYAGNYYRQKEAKGDKSYGGYANYHRCPAHFAHKIPAGLDPALAAPMMCGGVTSYSPLKEYGAGTTAKDVAIVGLGGLGHFAVLFAVALGANVTVISHSDSKKKNALEMGAKDFIVTHGGDDWAKNHKRKFDLIVSTTNDTEMPIAEYLTTLKVGGNFIMVGAPEKPLPQIPAFIFLTSNVHIGGSAIGGSKRIDEMLELAAKQNVKTWIEKRPLKDVGQAVMDMNHSKARYRYVLVNTDNGGKL